MQKVRKLKKAMPFDLAMLELLRTNGNATMGQIASLACLSLRQFERVSKDRLGMSPKLFARLVRFSKAYRMRENFLHLRWTTIAHQCGYFDQMHFIRDFKEFAGVAPGILEMELQDLPVRLQAGLRL
jgi:AraC-like DNA-binding protein